MTRRSHQAEPESACVRPGPNNWLTRSIPSTSLFTGQILCQLANQHLSTRSSLGRSLYIPTQSSPPTHSAAPAMPSLVPPPPRTAQSSAGGGVHSYFVNKIEAAELTINAKTQNLRRLEAQRNALNARGACRRGGAGRRGGRRADPSSGGVHVAVRLLREELQLLQEPGSYVGEVVKVMGKKKVLVKVQPEGRYGAHLPPALVPSCSALCNVREDRGETDEQNACATVVDFDPKIQLSQLTPNLRVALRSDSCSSTFLHPSLPIREPN